MARKEKKVTRTKKPVSKRKKSQLSGTDIPLAVFSLPGQSGVPRYIGMLVRRESGKKSALAFSWSTDGANFVPDGTDVVITRKNKTKEHADECHGFSIRPITQGFVMMYVRSRVTPHTRKKESHLVTAYSKDLYTWNVKSEEETDGNTAVFFYDGSIDKYIQYHDGLFIRHKSSPRFGVWPKKSCLLATARTGQFDEGHISLIGGEMTESGILIIYDASVPHASGHTAVQAGAMLVHARHPERVIWRSDIPIWQSIVAVPSEEVSPLGVIHIKGTMRIYWRCGDTILVASFPALFKQSPIATAPILKKSAKNPIIEPRGYHEWEGEGTFNPAAFQDDRGCVHLLYRALGRDGISRVGYASSPDGVHIHSRYAYPIFEPSRGFGMPNAASVSGPTGYNPAFYTSGGGWGGAEDPRVVKIDGRIYMTYVAFEGWDSVRIALTSISVDDFECKKWNWKKPILISPPGQVHKNWVLFPEKIHGKYAILHSVSPTILVDYVDDLDSLDTSHIKSKSPHGGRAGHWDNKMRGAGPPPVRTTEGWLLLYHAMDSRDPGKYKLGAMILDADDPTKIIHRTRQPILSPDMPYENNGKPGVVYASGAIVKDDHLYIYYGGADKVVCVATAPLKELLDYIKSNKPATYALQKVSA